MLQVLVYVVLLVDMVGYQVYWVTPYHQYLNQYWIYIISIGYTMVMSNHIMWKVPRYQTNIFACS